MTTLTDGDRLISKMQRVRCWNPSPLMEWAKERGTDGTFNLSCSGVPSITDLNEIPGGPFRPQLSGHNYFGHEGLKNTLAAMYGVDSAQILIAQGASQCNFLMAGAALASGGRAIVETPAYEPTMRGVEVWADEVVRLPRRKTENFQPDPDELRDLLTDDTRLILLTNLHNPSHVALERERLAAIIAASDRVGAAVMLDEVFLPMIERDYRRHAAVDGAISINSLGKSWGLDSLRVGWAVGPKDLVREAYRLNNLMGVNQPYMTEDLAHLILQKPEAVRFLIAKANQAAANKDLLEDFVRQTPQVSHVKPSGAISALVELPPQSDDDAFARALLNEQGTVVFPGRYFECPGCLRVSFGESRETTREGLRRLSHFIKVRP